MIKIVIGLVLLVIIVLFSQFSSDNSDKNIAPKENIKSTEQKNTQANNDIKILYLESEKEEVVEKKVVKKQTNKKTKKSSKEKEEFNDTAIKDLKYEKAKEYIEKNNLVKLSYAHKQNENDQIKKFEVYADISIEEAKANKNSDLPPSAPVFYTVTFPSGTTSVRVIDGDLYNQAEVLLVTKTDSDGNITEMTDAKPKDIPQEDPPEDYDPEEVIIIAPPSIGK